MTGCSVVSSGKEIPCWASCSSFLSGRFLRILFLLRILLLVLVKFYFPHRIQCLLWLHIHMQLNPLFYSFFSPARAEKILGLTFVSEQFVNLINKTLTSELVY